MLFSFLNPIFGYEPVIFYKNQVTASFVCLCLLPTNKKEQVSKSIFASKLEF